MTILVTGGSKGIGRGVALRFASEGAHVLINYATDDDAAEQAACAVRQVGGTVDLIRADLSTPTGLATLCQAVRKHTPTLDQVVHCAVWPHSSAALSVDAATFAQAAWTNGWAFLALVQDLHELMDAGGSIFLVTSRGSELAVPNYVAVGAPKAMAEALVRYLAVELAGRHVRVNSLSISTVVTEALRTVRSDADDYATRMADLNPSGRNVLPEDVGGVVWSLSSDDFAMVTGRKMHIDGGVYTAAH